MRQLAPIAIALLLVTCGGAPPPAAATASPAPSPSLAVAVTSAATPAPTYAPKAEGFTSKLLVEKPRNLGTSAPGLVWIAKGATTDGVSAAISDAETFTASYQPSADRPASDKLAYTTGVLPPLAAGMYGESLRLVAVQPGGRSAAHMHSGIEGVLVLEGQVLVRTAGNTPASLAPGQGFYILPKVPVQLINVGGGVARTLVYSISPEGAPFSTELDQAP